MTPHLKTLIADMVETMRAANGVGLAAPQVGILKRLVVIECEEGGIVTRPMHVIVKALDEEMQPVTVEGEELLARALCHEIDHLDGHLYTEVAEELYTNEELEAMQEEEAAEERE